MAELLHARTSSLVMAPLTPHVVGWEVFSQLPPSAMQKLGGLLPEADQGQASWSAALRCEQLAEAVRTWQMQLGTGEFDPGCAESLRMRKQHAQRKDAKTTAQHQQRLREALEAEGSAAARAFAEQLTSVAQRAAAEEAARRAAAKSGVVRNELL